MNVGHWTPSPQIEKEVALEERQLVRSRRLTRVGISFLAVSLPVTGMMFIVGTLVQPILVPFAALLFFGSLWLGNRLLTPYDQPDLTREFSAGERSGWLVAILVHQGDAPMGSDRGVLWIEDDRLYFAGRRTSFGLTADQANGLLEVDPATPGVRNDLELRLNHEGPAGALGISFSQIDSTGRLDGKAHKEMIERINRWIGQGAARGGQLPPLDFGPDAPSLPALVVRAGGSVGFWSLLVVSFPTLIYLEQPVLAVLLLFTGILTGSVWSPVWSPLLRVRAWHDRRRLADRLD